MKHRHAFSFLLVAEMFAHSILLSAQTTPIKFWDYRYGGKQSDTLTAAIPAIDGGFLLGGYSNSGLGYDKSQPSQGKNDYWIVKITDLGVKSWDKRFGGSGNDCLQAMCVTQDGGYLLAGYSESGISGDRTVDNRGKYDYWLVKITLSGIKVWDKRYGGDGNDLLQSVHPTSDGGFLLGGYSESNISGDKTEDTRGGNDYWLVKIDANGNQLWDSRFGGCSDDDEYAAFQNADGGYFSGGLSHSSEQCVGDVTAKQIGGKDFWIVKSDSAGNKLWDARFGGNDRDIMYDAKQTAEGGYLLGGLSASALGDDLSQPCRGQEDYWLVKTDKNGVKQWEQRYGGNRSDVMRNMQLTLDDGLILGGHSSSDSINEKSQGCRGLEDYWLVKTDNQGTRQWDVRFGGFKSDILTVVLQTPDAGYLLCGYSGSPASGDKTQDGRGKTDYWVVKISPVLTTWYADADGDGYGNAAISTTALLPPAGYVGDHFDCDDANAQMHPYANEICNGIDDNCDGVVDLNSLSPTISPAGPVSFCQGASITISANAGSGLTYQWLKGGVPLAGETNATYTASKKGDYQVSESTDNYNCTTLSATTSANSVSKPDAAITALGNIDICLSGSVDLQANSGSGLSYQWKKGSSNISGATNQIYTATTAATYKVVVTDDFGCSKTSSGIVVTKSCREETQKQKTTSTVSIYPNPTDGRIVINLSLNYGLNENGFVALKNIFGAEIFSQSISVTDVETVLQFKLPDDLPNGIYLVNVKANDLNYSQQILLEK